MVGQTSDVFKAEYVIFFRADVLQKHGQSFLDWKVVRVHGGNGGDGSLSLASEHRKEFAGPDGGQGGNGGHVLFQATKKVSTLERVPTVIKAADGVHGLNKKLDGKNASHAIVEVPVGTIFRNMEREIVAELTHEGEMFLAAKGGAGGRGNTFFKSSTCQAPEWAEMGGQGEVFSFEMGKALKTK